MPAKHDAATDTARRRYNETHMRKLTANVPTEEAETFRAACAAEGATVNAVLRRLMREYAASADKEVDRK